MPIQRHPHLFLNFIPTDKRVEMEEDCISTILNWPEPQCVREVQSFLGFANFYRLFVKGFSRIAHPLTNTIRDSTENKERSSRAEERFFDAGGSQIFSRVKNLDLTDGFWLYPV